VSTPFDDDRSGAAGEYVMGTLSEAERSRFEEVLAGDIDLQREVYHWQDRLLALSAQTAPAQPSAALWPRIAAGLTPLVAPVTGAPTRRAVAAPPSRPPWWQRLGWWQGLSGLSVAVSVLLATVLLLQQPGTPAGPRYLALLQSPDGQATGWVVEVQAGRELRLVPLDDRTVVPAGRALQFWTKPDGAAGPTSLGLVRAGQTVVMPASKLPAVGPKQLFEITLEPATGSPIGRPTGPILFVGRSVSL
jgi:anti-sigma-K factor RskA